MRALEIFSSSNRLAVLTAVLIFVVLPFVHSGATIDSEISPRFFLLSVYLCITSLYIVMNAASVDASLLKSLTARREIVFFILLILLSAFSLLRSVNREDGLYALSRLMVMGLLWIFLIFIQYKKRKAFYELIPFVNFSVLIFSIYGLLQVVLDYREPSADEHTFFNPRDITSTLGNYSYYSGTMLLSMPFSICGILHSKGWLKYISFSSLLLAMLTIIMLHSMNVILALSFSAAVTICLMLIFPANAVTGVPLRNSKWKAIFLIVAVFFICAIVFRKSGGFVAAEEKMSLVRLYIKHPDMMDVNSNINNNSVFERLLLWRNSLKLVKEYPVFGCGIADWKVEMPKYRVTGNSLLNLGQVRFDHPDNDYLLVAAETGLFGLMFYLLIFFFVLKKILNTLRFPADKDQRLLSLLLFFGVLAFMLMSLFENPKERFYPMALLMTMFASIENHSTATQSRRKNHSTFSRITFSVFFILMLAFAVVFIKRYESEAYLKEAIAAQENQQWTDMKQNLSKARSISFSFDLLGTPLEWYMGLANYYSGNTDQSFLMYVEATKKNPYHLQAWNDLGTLYDHLKNYKLAIGCYRRALDLNPYFSQGILNLTAAYFNAGEVDSAYQTIVRHEVDYTNTTYCAFLLAVLRAKVHASSPAAAERLNTLEGYKSDSLLLKTFDSCRQSGGEFKIGAMEMNH